MHRKSPGGRGEVEVEVWAEGGLEIEIDPRTCTHTKIRHTRSRSSDLAEVTAKIHENMRSHTTKHKHGHIQERRLGEKKMKHDLVWSHLKLENVGHSSPAR